MTTNTQDSLNHTFFSWSKQGGLAPIHIERAEGVYLYDQSGKRYIDFSSQLMNVNIGHGDQRVTDAVMKQMKQVSYIAPSMVTNVRGQLGKKLAEITPGNLTKTFFTLGGAEAIENSIKLARLYTGRHKILAQYRSYHGATYGAISAGGDPRKLQVDHLAAPGMVHFENPYFYRCPWSSNSPEQCAERCVAQLERIIQYEGPQNIAAIILEGESGTSGCIKYPPNYWRLIREVTAKYGILIIDDEVMSGFGRTGSWFGIDHSGVVPDMIATAKGLTAGYLPLGALIVSDTIAKTFDDKALPLGLTYSAHPVSCSSALAVLNIYESDNLIEKANHLSTYLEEKMADLIERHPSIGDFRNTGLLGVIELVKNRETKEPMAPWNAKPHEMVIMKEVAAKIRELGMFTFVKWNFIFVAPPLIATEAQIDEGLDIISQAIRIADQHYNG